MYRIDLQQKILDIKKAYIQMLREYYEEKYKLECQDDKYKDSEDNIFGDKEKTKLGKFIADEAQLYRNGLLRYKEKLDIVNKLSGEIDTWLRSMVGRATQGFDKAKVMVKSEKYYLKDMLIRLHFYSQILSMLASLETYEDDLLRKGIELSADCEYETYLLNKCILLSQVGYCKDECTTLVKELSSRVGNNSSYSGDFYYILAELNFSLQRYTEAQPFLDTAISILNVEVKNSRTIEDGRRNQIHDMLFAAHQLKALGYEFCGEFSEAIKYLTGKSPQEVVDAFRNVLPTSNFDCLAYSSDIDGRYGQQSRQKRLSVMNLVDEMTSKKLFSSPMAEYVYEPTHQEILRKAVSYENNKILDIISKCIKDQAKGKKVYLANAINIDDVNLVHEYIHILAHCINEYGVTFMKRCNEEEVTLAKEMILIGRAFMLFVSEKRSIYKSCYATTYAEAGDTWIAKNELLKMIEHEDYANYDVTTKAEIAFFYYLINSMSLIEDDAFDSNEEMDSGLINRYFNYCYRNFDYDAIAHMRVYSFRNRIAEQLQSSSLNKMAERFLEFAQKEIDGKTAYQEFVDHVYFQNSNKRLKNEYEKVKYMYHFLFQFFQQCSADKKETVKRTSAIFDCAFKYIYYYNATLSNVVGNQIDYIDFQNVATAPDIMKKLLHGVVQKGNIIESDHCKLILIQNDTQAKAFASSFDKYEKEANRKMVFVACKNMGILQRQRKCHQKVTHSPKFRLFAPISKGLKEFFIFTVFFMVKDDFFNPNNIFVMTPIGTAKACRHRVSSDLDMITQCYPKNTCESFGELGSITTQYRVVASEAHKKEISWESELNKPKYQDYISYIISITYDIHSASDIVKYRYKYSVSDTWKEARLFMPTSWKENMDTIYDDMKYDRDKIDSHSSECAHSSNHCSVVLISNSEDDDETTFDDSVTFRQLLESLFNISNINFRNALIWRGENGPYVGWRIISLTDNCPELYMLEIQQAMCHKGQGLTFQSITPPRRYQWPDPHDYSTSNDKFIFVSHYTRGISDDSIVKRELNDFFLKCGIPIWYDKEKEIALDSWKDRITPVLNHPNCVGIIVLVTNPRFFESDSIQYELLVAQEKRTATNYAFSVIPIVYGVVSNNQQLQEMLRTQVKDADNLRSIEDLILPTQDKVITYLQPNQSLREYTQQELGDGRDGSVFAALARLNVNYSKGVFL